MTLRVVDAHHHFWDPTRNYHPWLCDEPPIPFRYGDYSAIRRPYLPDDLRRDARCVELVASVYVETEWDPTDGLGEVRWVHDLAAREGLPNAVVAQAWLDAPDAPDAVAELATWPLVRGVRHKPACAASPGAACRGLPGSMDDPAWRRGYAALAQHGMRFDLQTPWWHLDAALDLARDYPHVAMILNHAGLPGTRDAETLAAWREAVRALAEADNVSVKVSGLGQPGMAWTLDANREVVLTLIDAFGVDRCLFASNFPVDSLCVDYATLYAGFDAITSGLDPSERDALFRSNAIRWYALDIA